MQPEILFEDNHLLVVNKPAGILTQPSGTTQNNLEDLCKEWIKETYHKPGRVFLEAVHRLDKPVSGIVVFARTSKALSRLNESMRAQQFHKIYCAVVEGKMERAEGVLEHYLLHDEYQSVVVNSETPQAKKCRLHYRVIEQKNIHSLLEITLETGRYHQIRAQLSATGHPVVGDAKYKSRETYLAEGIALHHSQLKFPHPTKDQVISIEAPLPKALIEVFSLPETNF